jgi:acetoin utilization deacetylase AcuC-like enzyme
MKREKITAHVCLVGIMLRAQSAALQPPLFCSPLQKCLFFAESSCAPLPTNAPKLAASRLGLDPSLNRFHAPIVNHENYSFKDWPPNHTFPMDKFARLAHALTTTSSKTHSSSNLPRPLVRDPSDFFRPYDLANVPRDWLAEPTGPISSSFLDRFMDGQLEDAEKRYIGFRELTSRPELIERTILEVAGTVLAAQLAFRYGIASNVAGGTHHAHSTGGAGYTILNDLAVTANFLTNEALNEGSVTGIRRVLVVDCDVHQGEHRGDRRRKASYSFL